MIIFIFLILFDLLFKICVLFTNFCGLRLKEMNLLIFLRTLRLIEGDFVFKLMNGEFVILYLSDEFLDIFLINFFFLLNWVELFIFFMIMVFTDFIMLLYC